MAQEELDDLGFLLPSELLTDDDFLTDFKTKPRGFSGGYNGDFLGLSSGLVSPVDSATGTESDEDDFLAELTRMVSQSALLDSAPQKNTAVKGWGMSTSPESTLCGYKPGQNPGAGWDLVYKAAEEVAKVRSVHEEAAALYSSKKLPLPPPSTTQSPVTVAQPNPTPASGLHPPRTQTQAHHSFQQLQAAKMKQQQGMREQGRMEYNRQNERRNGTMGTMGNGQGLSMSAWPTLQQSQQTAAFLGDNAAKKERVGTGVFMPRRIEPNVTHPRKKQGSPAVFLPDRVVQALNRNIDSINAEIQQRANGTLTTQHDARFRQTNRVVMPQQKRSPVMNQELSLPQDWSY